MGRVGVFLIGFLPDPHRLPQKLIGVPGVFHRHRGGHERADRSGLPNQPLLVLPLGVELTLANRGYVLT